MGLFDFLFGNKKEKERLEKERLAEQERIRIAEEKRIAEEREKRLAENRRKEAERLARLEAEKKAKQDADRKAQLEEKKRKEDFTNTVKELEGVFKTPLVTDLDSILMDKEAMGEYDKKNYTKAIEIYNTLINKHPNAHQYYTSRGTVYEDMGDDISAKKDFLKATELQPKDSLAQYRLGMVYYREKNLQKTVEHLTIAYENHPTYDNIMGNAVNNITFIHKKVIASNLGNFLTQVGRREEGYKILDEVMKKCPNYAFPFYAKGLALAMENNFTDALLCLNKAKELGHPQAQAVISQILSQTQKRDDTTDKYSDMVDNASYNPYNITTDPNAVPDNALPDLRAVFKRELVQSIRDPFMRQFGVKGAIGGYAFNMIESYYKNAGYVPKVCVDQILEQIYDAIQETEFSSYLESLEELKDGIYPQLFSRD